MSIDDFTPVEWRPWPADPRYQAASNGAILGPRGHVLHPWVSGRGYQQITACKGGPRGNRRNPYVHIIVCEAWHGPRPAGARVRFRNGDPLDCRPENLEWRDSSSAWTAGAA